MRRMWLALLAALLLALSACGEGGAGETADDAEDTEDQAAAEDDAGDAAAEDDGGEEGDAGEEGDDEAAADDSGEGTVQVASTDLGDVLVDAEGMTLYLFESDSDGESTCYDDCEANWPPLIDEEPVAGEGADDGMLGTAERDDGSVQVTYNDWPLYYWAGDNEPGDVDGQSVGDVWWVVDPMGEAIKDAEADSGGGSGY